jgi:phospholipid/cholesterol/gamma-HCH transport system permease protein
VARASPQPYLRLTFLDKLSTAENGVRELDRAPGNVRRSYAVVDAGKLRIMLNVSLETPGKDENSPRVRVSKDGNAVAVLASGSWTVRDLSRIEAELKRNVKPVQVKSTGIVVINLAELQELDTAGAWLLDRLDRDFQSLGVRASFSGATEAYAILLDEVRRNTRTDRPERQRRNKLGGLASDALKTLSEIGADLVQITSFLGELTITTAKLALQPWRFRWTSFIHHLDHAGLRAAPIVSLISLMIGAVILQQGVVQLRRYGSEPFAVDLLGVLALREVGVILTAVMVAGRSASAFTAEIGTMKMREEIDAMRTLGIDPIETLVAPRVFALIVALPVLTFIGDVMCLAGGGLMSMVYLDFNAELYLQRLHDAVSIRHFLVGLAKAPFAALIIGLVGCLEGLKVTGSAESVGVRVTSSVVKAIFLVFILDAAFAIFMAASGF